ncbi:SRPBCC family protein [Streptomyces sp. NPDC059063]|uniref:SRPBCC family protein n=1 Tax=unclassified Streptomyces TaxID=2593676 RepID=UPI003677D34B
MTLFHFERATPLDPAEAWRRLTDWERHGQVVPLTRVTVSGDREGGAGTVFTARSGVGPLGFDDVMEVVVWRPPGAEGADRLPGAEGAGLCRLAKRGSFVTGWAEIEVRPEGDASRVVWREELRVRGLPGVVDPLLRRAAVVLFGRAVDALLAERR